MRLAATTRRTLALLAIALTAGVGNAWVQDEGGPCDGAAYEMLGPWVDGVLADFSGTNTVSATFSTGQSEHFFWTEHYNGDLWRMKYWPATLCNHNPKLGSKGFNSPYAMGYLHGWLFHEAMHSCLPPDDNGAGGADPDSCLHLALDNTAHGEACSKAASIKGDDCDDGGTGGEGPEEPEGDGDPNAEDAGDSQSDEQSGDGEGSDGGLTPEEEEELEGLCDFMQEMQDKWTNDEAANCIENEPLSQGAKDCGLSYPPGPSPGADGEASAIGGCGCC